MTPELLDTLYQIVAFLFAISVHESAHAWTAWRCGDPTAYMLGRVSLNPIKHIDPIGTVLLPAIAAFAHVPVIGWAKPTPVNTRNFSKLIKYDILTSLAGPVSNMLVAVVATVLIALLARTSAAGHDALFRPERAGSSVLVPIMALLSTTLLINVILAVFNLIPVPPLDGSHVIRHFLSGSALAVYDQVGRFGIVILFVVSWRTGLLNYLFAPAIWFAVLILRVLAG